MGRPLFSVSFTNSVGSGDDLRLGAVAEEGSTTEETVTLRRWCEKDADPDDDAWWTGKDVVIESFVDQPIKSDDAVTACAHVEEVPTTAQPAARIVADEENNIHSGKLMLQPSAQIQNDHNIDLAALFPARFTISEEELAQVTLDSIITNEDNNDDDYIDDFELVWDENGDEYEEDDMDVDEADASHSDASTPAPSTPVMEPTHVVPSSMHDFAGQCILSAPATAVNVANPSRQGSFHLHAPSMSPPSATRPVARVRGFAVHSPRTELVL